MNDNLHHGTGPVTSSPSVRSSLTAPRIPQAKLRRSPSTTMFHFQDLSNSGYHHDLSRDCLTGYSSRVGSSFFTPLTMVPWANLFSDERVRHSNRDELFRCESHSPLPIDNQVDHLLQYCLPIAQNYHRQPFLPKKSPKLRCV